MGNDNSKTDNLDSAGSESVISPEIEAFIKRIVALGVYDIEELGALVPDPQLQAALARVAKVNPLVSDISEVGGCK